MNAESESESPLAIGHVLFMDIVGYSKLLSNEQRELFQLLNEVVCNTQQFRTAETAGKLVLLPTGDGMALAFFTSPDAPVRCAREINRRLQEYPKLGLRMGINSGPVDEVVDVNGRRNATGAGINLAQRVMDCGDAGHILIARRVADDLAQYGEWRPDLHDLGEVEVKHGVRVALANFYGEGFGNPRAPEKITRAKQARRRRLVLWLSALLFLLCVIIGSWIRTRRVALSSAYKVGAAGIIEKSIAVLPFESLAEDKENIYFADGVQDDILTDLAKVADLKVISRRSVAQYRGSTQDVREIGRALQVAHVLEGSVRKVGNKVHVTAQLIDTRTEAQTWAEKYERDLADVFAIQSDISQTIVAQLRAALSPSEKTAIETAPTRDMEAYDLYLRSKEFIYSVHSREPSEGDLTKAVDLLQQAIARDPKFVLAYCFLAQLHISAFWFGEHDPAELEQAKAALETARKLAPDSGEVHLAQGVYFYHGLRDFQRALPELAIAARVLPNNADICSWTGLINRRAGHWSAGLRNQVKAVELDPHDSSIRRDLLSTYWTLRNYPEAERLIARGIIAVPQDADFFRMTRAEIALMEGDLKKCRADLESLPQGYEHGGFVRYLWGRLAFYLRDYAEVSRVLDEARKTLGETAEWWISRDRAFLAKAEGDAIKAQSAFQTARKFPEETLNKQPDDPGTLGMLALFDAGLGHKEEALRESQKAVELRPISRDAVEGPGFATLQAQVYAWCGEREMAIKQLAVLVKLPGGPTFGDLQFDPAWDDLRSDPRFPAILADAARPVKID